MIKTGQRVRVRRVGDEQWVSAKVDLASNNQLSLALSAEAGLSTREGFLLNPETRQMVLLLLKEHAVQSYYQDIVMMSDWEVSEIHDSA